MEFAMNRLGVTPWTLLLIGSLLFLGFPGLSCVALGIFAGIELILVGAVILVIATFTAKFAQRRMRNGRLRVDDVGLAWTSSGASSTLAWVDVAGARWTSEFNVGLSDDWTLQLLDHQGAELARFAGAQFVEPGAVKTALLALAPLGRSD